MRLFLCFFFMFSSLTPAFSDDCGCAGDAKPLALDKRAANATRGNLFEEITTHSISTASSDTLTGEGIKKKLAELRERYITNHRTRSIMCEQFMSSDPNEVRKFAKTLKTKRISLEKVFLNLKCPIRSDHYALCQNPDIPDDKKRDAMSLPLCGDIFFLASFYPTSANSLFTIIDSLIEHDREQRFLPKVLQCKRLTRTFYNGETDRMETRCLLLVDIVENNLNYRMTKYPSNKANIEAFAKIRSAFKRDYFKLLPDESPPTKEFCQKYANLSCHEDLPDSNAW